MKLLNRFYERSRWFKGGLTQIFEKQIAEKAIDMPANANGIANRIGFSYSMKLTLITQTCPSKSAGLLQGFGQASDFLDFPKVARCSRRSRR